MNSFTWRGSDCIVVLLVPVHRMDVVGENAHPVVVPVIPPVKVYQYTVAHLVRDRRHAHLARLFQIVRFERHADLELVPVALL